MSSVFETLQPGDTFKLTPKARTKWLMFGEQTYGRTKRLMFGAQAYGATRSSIEAVRCDSQVGQKLLIWIAAGKDPGNPPVTRQEVAKVSKLFYQDDLEGAVRSL